jgi:hypothetical protein
MPIGRRLFAGEMRLFGAGISLWFGYSELSFKVLF